ncbi:MAG: O-antigen ligase family protein [Oscillospiraceae bacterium]|jgi:O-antigen ligase|nr:O-antigen ligase family protein [Oscillospiraceae bacterium]
MAEILKSSLVWRFFMALAALYRRSPLARAVAAVGRAWRDSATYRFFAKRLTAQSAVERACYRRLLDALNAGLWRMGKRLQGARETSVLLRAGRQSFFWRAVSHRITPLLLLVIAAYAPIDYALRDWVQLPSLAAVWDELLLIFGFFWVLRRAALAERPLRSRANRMDFPLAFYLLAGVLLLLCVTPYPSINITGFRASLQYLLLFFLVTRLIRDEKDFNLLYHAMIAIATVIALHGIWQFIIGVEIPENWTDNAEGSVRTRVFSIFSNPNIMGAYMLLFAPMAIGRAYAAKGGRERVFFWSCGIAMCLSCLFTMSRGAWLALAVAALLFAVIVDRKLLALMLLGGVFACFLPFVRSRLGYLFTASFAESNARGGREKRWSAAIRYLKQFNVWTGMGYGMYGGAVAVQNPVLPGIEYMYVDNYYVKILVENGILGLSAFLLSLWGMIWGGLCACARTVKTRLNPLCAGMLAGLVGILVQSFFESVWEEPYMMAIFFAIAGMLACAGSFSKENM